MNWSKVEIEALERFFRANLINSATGFKSLCLLGSRNEAGTENLAVFTQILHVGADPAMLGILFRPIVAGMHSLNNIRETGWFTLNHVLDGEAEAAHWTSARWEVSEFEATGFNTEYLPQIPAPFVKGSRVRMALQPVREIPIEENGTTFLLASLQYLEVPDFALKDDGFADLVVAGSMAGTGLDGYANASGLKRFSYARTNEKPQSI